MHSVPVWPQLVLQTSLASGHATTFDGEVEYQTEMATYVLFTVHTDDDNDTDDTLIFYSIERISKR